MLKKAIIGGLALTLVAGIMLGSDFGSYFRTMKRRAHDAVKSEMDLDFEVDRARTMIEDLVPAIESCQEAVIEQQVKLAGMEVSIVKQEEALDKAEGEMFARRAELDSGKQKFRHAKMTFTRTDLKRDLDGRLARYKAADAALARDKKIMLAQRDSLRANQQLLENMVGQKKELEVAVAQLEARLEQLHAEEAITTLAIDDSQLSKAKQLVQDLNTQLDVRERMINAEASFTGFIPVEPDEEASDRDITAEFDDYFGNKSSKKAEQTDDEVLDPAA